LSDTRPGELSRAEAQRIAQETAALLKIVDNEREYREHVLVTLARLEVKSDNLHSAFESHVADDDRRFEKVTQGIGTTSSQLDKGTGIIIAMVALLGFIMWLIDRVQS
jgi:hypothetical protein